MGEKLGWLGEKLAFGCGALFSWIVVVQGALTACRGGGWACGRGRWREWGGRARGGA